MAAAIDFCVSHNEEQECSDDRLLSRFILMCE